MLVGRKKGKVKRVKETELKPCAAKKDTENWLLSRGVFVDCRNCVTRKAGCFKDCKVYNSYKKGADNEQREKA